MHNILLNKCVIENDYIEKKEFEKNRNQTQAWEMQIEYLY